MTLAAQDLAFSYRAQTVLDGVSLRIAPGEIVALHAPSGAGKTTLGRLLAGYLAPHAGAITLDGAPVCTRGFHPVQMIHQNPHAAANPRWRAARILREPGAPNDADLTALGVEASWMDRHPNELSGGQLQRVVIARALAPGVRYLVADEITSQLDAISQVEIWRALTSIAQRRKLGVLAIAHDADFSAHVANRVIHLPAPGASRLERVL